MRARDFDVLVVGGGPAGLSAAGAAAVSGARVLLAERDVRLGGILNQCVHDGFGLELFGESLTGPEYAARQIEGLAGSDVEVILDASVLRIESDGRVHLLSPSGYSVLEPGAVVLAMGCRERSFASLVMPSCRPAGIWSAGTAQRLVNLEGLMVGRRVVILGSGDVGLIMARRLTLEGARVECVLELYPYPGGLPRNVSQCLNDFGIPLLLRHTVLEVLGKDRVAGVVIAGVGDDSRPLPGTERTIECDTLLVSVGLIPENELTREAGGAMDLATGGPVVDQQLMTSILGVFAAGNALHVHDLADWASLEGRRAGELAAAYAREPWVASSPIAVRPSGDVRYVVPQTLRVGEPATLSFRVTEPRRRALVSVSRGGEKIVSMQFPYLSPSELATIEVPALAAGDSPLEVLVD